MSKLNSAWVVQPHGPLEEVAPGVLCVQGSIVMPLGKFPRRMTVVEVRGGSAIWSAIPLAETEMSKIEALGPVKFLIVPNKAHRLDLRAWCNRYPQAKVIAPPEAVPAASEAAIVAADHDIIHDPALTLELIPGLKADEFAMTIRREGDTTLVLNDILAHVAHPEGIGATIMAHLFAFGVTRPRTSRPVRRAFVKDDAVVANQFRTWALIPDLKRVIVSHGDIIRNDPAGALRRAAEDYD